MATLDDLMNTSHAPGWVTITAMKVPPASTGLGHATRELLVQAHELCKDFHVAGSFASSRATTYTISSHGRICQPLIRIGTPVPFMNMDGHR